VAASRLDEFVAVELSPAYKSDQGSGMSSPTTSLEIPVLRDAFVRPFYLRLLHGNCTRLSETDGDIFRRAAASAANAISDEQIRRLLTEREWRGRLCAAWFIGLSKRASFIHLIAAMLLASELVYAAQGYCAALGLIGGDESARVLCSYLETYLPLNGRIYNQDWAIGALAHVEGTPPPEFVEKALWRDGTYFLDPAEGIERFGEIVTYLRQYGIIEDAN
jgi:hypothetical protein